MKQGDTVLVEAWSLDSGHSIEEYRIVQLDAEQISLSHTATYRRSGSQVDRTPGTGETRTYGKRMIEHLSIPFEERWEQHLSDIRWLCENLSGISQK